MVYLSPTHLCIHCNAIPTSSNLQAQHLFNGQSPYQNVSILDVIGVQDDGNGGDNCSYKMCKAPVKLTHQQTKTELFAGRMPLLLPNQVSEHWWEVLLTKLYNTEHAKWRHSQNNRSDGQELPGCRKLNTIIQLFPDSTIAELALVSCLKWSSLLNV